jgi:hypothetical protein
LVIDNFRQKLEKLKECGLWNSAKFPLGRGL